MKLSQITAALAGGALLLSASACADDAVFSSAVSSESDPAAAGISIPANASIFRTSALGPDRLNFSVREGTPMSFVNPQLLDSSGHLPEGMSITEAQALQVVEKIRTLLADQKRKLFEVATIRVYLSPDGTNDIDFEGWERAYRRYFANIDRETGGSLLTEAIEPTATSTPGPAATSTAAPTSTSTTSRASDTTATSTEPYPGSDNRTRPTLVTVGVAQQPVKGWLVQVEVEVVHGED